MAPLQANLLKLHDRAIQFEDSRAILVFPLWPVS